MWHIIPGGYIGFHFIRQSKQRITQLHTIVYYEQSSNQKIQRVMFILKGQIKQKLQLCSCIPHGNGQMWGHLWPPLISSSLSRSAKFEQTASRCSSHSVFTRIIWTDRQPKNTMPLAVAMHRGIKTTVNPQRYHRLLVSSVTILEEKLKTLQSSSPVMWYEYKTPAFNFYRCKQKKMFFKWSPVNSQLDTD